MDWFLPLFRDDSVARTVLLLAIAGGAGVALGKIRVFGVSLGIAGVLFVDLFLG
ncbi:MAG TPA: hypothetical protein VHE61_05535 [Opitutaceae bacterium]|nr:hypothetical protein [Opitutaceae bacterium]